MQKRNFFPRQDNWYRHFLSFLLLTILCILAVGSSDTNTRGGRTDDVHGAWAYMQLFVEERLKSPKSADFPFGGYQHVTALGSGRYKVDSYVDSQNSFGSNIRTNFEGVIKRTDGGWELEYLNFK